MFFFKKFIKSSNSKTVYFKLIKKKTHMQFVFFFFYRMKIAGRYIVREIIIFILYIFLFLSSACIYHLTRKDLNCAHICPVHGFPLIHLFLTYINSILRA